MSNSQKVKTKVWHLG